MKFIVDRNPTGAWSGLAGEWPLSVVAWASRSSAAFGASLYREAVSSQSPRVPLRLPWVLSDFDITNRNAVAAPIDATRSGLEKMATLPRVEATLGFAT